MSNLKDFFQLGEVTGYFFRKNKPEHNKTFTLKAMHIINKISIMMFIGGLIFLTFKLFLK
jgi:hypothetical protein